MLNLWPQQSSSLVIGHRGAMGYAPENTLLSFEEGLRRGADLLEMDVQLSADNEVVVMHDTSVDRTTDGSGFIRDLAWKKIKTFDAGVWFGPDSSNQFVPSLSEVITAFRHRKTTKKHSIGFVIELKTVRGSGGSLADAVVALLLREDFTDRAIVISFDAVALQEVRAAHKTLPTGLLFNEDSDEGRIAQAKAIGVQAIFPRKTWVTTRGVAAAHKAGLAVGTWTCNTKNEMKRMAGCGVDAIVTNFPDRLRSILWGRPDMLRAIIFDMDGVICDSENLHMQAFQEILKGEGIMITDQEYYDKYLAHDDRGSFESALGAHARPAPDVKTMNALVAAKGRVFEGLMKDGLVIYPGADTLIKKASIKYSLALASGARRLEVEYVLKKAKIRDIFSAIVSADEVKNGKPQPEAFQRALLLLNQMRLDGTPEILASQTLVIEDSPRCIRTAKSLGMKTVGMATSYKPPELQEADLVIDSLLGLELETLEKLFA